MPRIITTTWVTLDGFIATTDHSLDWLMQFGSLEGTSYDSVIRDVGALAMGESTYEWLLRELATNCDVKGDTTTLEDLSVIAKLKENEEA